MVPFVARANFIVSTAKDSSLLSLFVTSCSMLESHNQLAYNFFFQGTGLCEVTKVINMLLLVVVKRIYEP
jgi:hypothetical protein